MEDGTGIGQRHLILAAQELENSLLRSFPVQDDVCTSTVSLFPLLKLSFTLSPLSSQTEFAPSQF